MPGYGRPPAEHKRRRNKDAFAEAQVTLDNAAKIDAPSLPKAKSYSAATRAWYQVWCNSPQAETFTATDWQRLHMIAPLVERYFSGITGDAIRLMAEIRINESLLGATHVDRMRARMKLERQTASDDTLPQGVSDLAARRRRITDAA